jgi:uncharacterized membrane protein YoaK (UPF0700 family)
MSDIAASVKPAKPAGDSLAAAAVSIRHPLVRALAVLTFTTGLIDASSYLGLGHVFTANQTGNTVCWQWASSAAVRSLCWRLFAAAGLALVTWLVYVPAIRTHISASEAVARG